MSPNQINLTMASDFTTANNPRFLYFAELHRPFPQWIVESAIPSAEQFSKKASAAFADPVRRLLPVTDKVATFHSALDLFAHADDYTEDVFSRVKAACDFHGISDEVAPYAELFADKFEKSATELPVQEGRFAIRETLNGTDYRLLPLNDADEVSESAHELAKMAADNRIHFLTLQPAAVEIIKAAGEFGVTDIPEMLWRIGAERTHNADRAATLVAGREEMAKSANKADLKAAYEEAVATEDPGEAMRKIAAIDDAAGIRYHYKSAHVLLPSEIVYCGPLVSEVEKVASEHVMVNDVFIPLSEMKKIDLTEAEFKLSKSAGDTFSKVIDTEDARDISLAVMQWQDDDRRTLLRMAAAV